MVSSLLFSEAMYLDLVNLASASLLASAWVHLLTPRAQLSVRTMPGVVAAAATAASSPASSSASVKGKGKAISAEEAGVAPQKYSFGTLKRERRFAHPSSSGHDVPELEELVQPHIASFDALFEDGSRSGLLDLAVKDIDTKVVFDGRGKAQGKLGNKLECGLHTSATSATGKKEGSRG